MTAWQKVNKVIEDADKLKELEKLYMERGNVTPEEARQWAINQFKRLTPPEIMNEPVKPTEADLRRKANEKVS